MVNTAGTLWLKFDTTTRTFSGTPATTDIIQNGLGYYSDFTITVTCFDVPAQSSISTIWLFFFIFKNGFK